MNVQVRKRTSSPSPSAASSASSTPSHTSNQSIHPEDRKLLSLSPQKFGELTYQTSDILIIENKLCIIKGGKNHSSENIDK